MVALVKYRHKAVMLEDMFEVISRRYGDKEFFYVFNKSINKNHCDCYKNKDAADITAEALNRHYRMIRCQLIDKVDKRIQDIIDYNERKRDV